MKRYEKMTKEEVMKLCLANCSECELSKNNGNTFCSDNYGHGFCKDVKQEWLEKEIQTKSRWELCRTDEDFINMINEARSICNSHALCKDCEFHEKCDGVYTTYVIAYGTEKVEVEL